MGNLKAEGNQFGIVNLKVENLNIKIDIVEAALAFKKFIDGSNLDKLFHGIVVAIDKFYGWAKDTSGPYAKAISGSISAIRASASKASKVVSKLIQAVSGSNKHGENEIWSEIEVLNLLKKGSPVPHQAVQFVRHADVQYSNKILISEISKLTELRTLSFDSNDQEKDLHLISNLKKLRTLTLDIGRHADLTWLDQLTELETLVISGPYQNNAICKLPKIWSSEKLSSLTIDHLTIDEIPNFSGIKNLGKLTLRKIYTDDYNNISTAKNLINLVISNSNVSKFDFIEHLQELEDLDLRDNRIDSLSPTLRMPSLRTIYISRRISNARLLNSASGSVVIFGDYGGVLRRPRF